MKKIIKLITAILSIVLLNNVYNNVYADDPISEGTARYEGEYKIRTELFNSERDYVDSYLGRQVIKVGDKDYDAFCIDPGKPISKGNNAYKLYSGNKRSVGSLKEAEKYGSFRRRLT